MSEHGTNAAYVAGCRCDECRAATTRYHKALLLDHHRGIWRRVDATGTRRRIESLGALGWTGVQIGARVGMTGEHIRQLRSQQYVSREIHQRIAAVYGVLRYASPPENTRAERHNASRQRNMAARNGWVSPDLWLDIDDPNETPDPGYRPHRPHDEFDPIVVTRILGGDWTLARSASVAERAEVVTRWVDLGGSLKELERLTGWNTNRYRTEGAA